MRGARAENKFDAGKLRRYLADHLERFQVPIQLHRLTGGQSNPTYQLITPACTYVLRCKPPGKLLPNAHAIEREFRILVAMHTIGFPVPRPYMLCEDETIIGSVFYIMEHVNGRIYRGPLLRDQTSQQRHAIYDQTNATMARLHMLDWRTLGLADFGKADNYVGRQVARWTKQYRASETERIREMDHLIEWLPQHLPAASRNSIVHGDYRLDNIVLHPSEPRVIAVLDWELCTIGDPMADFTYHLMPWQMPREGSGTGDTLLGADLHDLGIPSQETYVGWYLQRTRADIQTDFDYYAAYNFFRLAAILQGVLGRVRDGSAWGIDAASNATRVRPLAERAWFFARRAGAPAA